MARLGCLSNLLGEIEGTGLGAVCPAWEGRNRLLACGLSCLDRGLRFASASQNLSRSEI